MRQGDTVEHGSISHHKAVSFDNDLRICQICNGKRGFYHIHLTQGQNHSPKICSNLDVDSIPHVICGGRAQGPGKAALTLSVCIGNN